MTNVNSGGPLGGPDPFSEIKTCLTDPQQEWRLCGFDIKWLVAEVERLRTALDISPPRAEPEFSHPCWHEDGDHFRLLINRNIEVHVYRYDGAPVLIMTSSTVVEPSHFSCSATLTEEQCRLLGATFIQAAEGRPFGHDDNCNGSTS